MSDLKLALLQVWYTNKAFRRNPAAAFFTLVFPLMFLVIFSVIFGNGRVTATPRVPRRVPADWSQVIRTPA